MRRVSLCIAVLMAFLVFPLASRADAIKGSTGSGWQSFPTSLDESGNPYWANPSMDGSQFHIGYFLTCSGAFASSSTCPNITPQWWGNANGSADLNFTFTSGAGGPITLVLEVAGFKDINEFGWYDSTQSSPNLNAIFAGSDSPQTNKAFTPTTDYGFYLKTKDGDTFFTESGRNAEGERDHQHFVVFRIQVEGQDFFWIGTEDLLNPGSEGQGDYNDLVARFQPVPEPGTMLLFGSGLAGVAAWRRKKRKT